MQAVTPVQQTNTVQSASSASTLTTSTTTPSTRTTSATPTVLFHNVPPPAADSKGDGLAAAIDAIDTNINTPEVMLGELAMQNNIFRETDGNTRNTMVRKWFKKSYGWGRPHTHGRN